MALTRACVMPTAAAMRAWPALLYCWPWRNTVPISRVRRAWRTSARSHAQSGRDVGTSGVVTVLGDDLGATALAAHAGVSARHLARLFLDQLGQTPAQFVRTARAEAAAQLLVSTALPLASIARRCGFSSA